MKKKQPLNAKVARQIEILQKYYDIDVENRIINFCLYYEKASDILLNDVVTLGDAPRFNNDVLRRISEVLDTFPIEFKVNLSLRIDDYEGYDPDALLSSLKDALEMFKYAIYKDKGLRWLTSAMLVFVSMSLIIFRLFMAGKELIDASGMFYEMLDIIAWVFLWEAVTIMFLTPGEIREISFKLMRRLLSISVQDKDGKTLVIIESQKLEEEGLQETKKEKLGRIFMLVGGTAFITLAVSYLVTFIGDISTTIGEAVVGDLSWIITFVIALISLFSVVIFAIGGIGAISASREKGPFKRSVIVFAILSFIVAALNILLLVYEEVVLVEAGLPINGMEIFQTLVVILVCVFYFVGYLLVRKTSLATTDLTD